MHSTVIIGAGPAGLAVATCLARRGVPFTWLERGGTLLHGLHRLDPEMRLLTPERLSRLPHVGRPPTRETYLSMAEVCVWLERHARALQLSPITDVHVRSIRPVAGGYAVESQLPTGATRLDRARCVVSCTGVSSWPHLPAGFDPQRTRLRYRHSRDLRAGDLKDVERLLIVGGGTSAREAFALWQRVARRPREALISLRSRPRAVPHRVLGLDTHYLAWLPEHVPASLPWLRRRLRATLQRDPTIGLGLSLALASRAARRAAVIQEYGDDHVITADGVRLQPELLVFATGYRYAVPHLDGVVERDDAGLPRVLRCESTTHPGIFLMGLRFGRTLASPFLRGIATDARYVADRIARQARRVA